MKIAQKPSFWLYLSIIYIIATFSLSSISNFFFVKSLHIDKISRYDLFVHFVEYALLAWLILRYLHLNGSLFVKGWIKWIPLSICAVIGALNEFWQMRIPNRSPSFDDAIANLLGAFLITIIYLWKFTKQPTANRVVEKLERN